MKSILALLFFVSCARALVHYVKLKKGKNGCLSPTGAEMTVWGMVQDEKVCGIYHCQNKQGDALIHYCQQPATFMHCNSMGVLTTTDFPQCCWMCCKFVACDGGKARVMPGIEEYPSDGGENSQIGGENSQSGGENLPPNTDSDEHAGRAGETGEMLIIPPEPIPPEPMGYGTENAIIMDSVQLDREGHPIDTGRGSKHEPDNSKKLFKYI